MKTENGGRSKFEFTRTELNHVTCILNSDIPKLTLDSLTSEKVRRLRWARSVLPIVDGNMYVDLGIQAWTDKHVYIM